MSNYLVNKLKSKKGQSSVEYILLAAMLVGAVVLFGGKFKSGIQSITSTLFSQGDDQIKNLTK